MCGIVGCIGEITKNVMGAFENMLVVDALRGPHSTGVFCATALQDNLVKKALLPQELMDLQAYKTATAGVPKLLLGHNRWATVGAVNAINAHPFDMGNIVGCHNGTLTAWKADFDDSAKFTVDSECLMHNIQKHGVDNAWKRLDGAATVAFWKRDERTLNLIRNEQRPLWLAHTKDEKTLFFASEYWMLFGCLTRNGIQFKDIFELEVNKLMTVDESARITLREVAPRPKFQFASTYDTRNTGSGPYKYKDEIEFEVVKLVGNGNVVTMHGRTTDKGKHEVRCALNPTTDAKLIDSLNNSKNFFLAEISYSNLSFSYILPDSIFELIEEDESEEETVVCAWCDEKVAKKNAIMVSYNSSQYVCPGCAEDPSMKDYLRLN